ncbi:MAG: hypothetical protein QGH60_18415 [Phycisphaerae bacterium]|jgi:hypothetical protein|nr:hypothetical protein [Phycisphaerae bacterium]
MATKVQSAILWTVLVGCIVPGAVYGAIARSVTITVPERGGAARTGEYVNFGVPIPRAWKITDLAALRLTSTDGKAIGAQFEVLARWGGGPDSKTAPVKWVLVGYLESMPAKGSKTVVLDTLGPGRAAPVKIKIDATKSGKMIVDTGAARFELNTGDRFNLFEQVEVAGKKLLTPLVPREAIRYTPAGKLSIVSGGKANLKPRATKAVIERAGPLGAVVRVAGNILDATSRPVLNFTARLHFTAGRSDVRVDFTVENNHPIIPTDQGQPGNARHQGKPNSVYIGDLSLRLRLAKTSAPLLVLTEQDTKIVSPKTPVRLYQDSSGLATWNAYVGKVGWPKEKALAHPRVQSYCTKKGYQITGGNPPAARTGDQALGWMTVQGAARITACVRDFWQNFPKAITADPDGTISVSLFPAGEKFRHNFRVGENKTHTILLDFGAGPATNAESLRLSQAFNRPLFGSVSPKWFATTGALGEVPPADIKRNPLYERYVRVAFEPNPDFDPNKDDANFGNRTLQQVIGCYNMYGWQDYGDVPLDYEAFGDNQAGQMNLKYWFLHGMLVQACRSGDRRWMDLARPAAMHLADIDILHIPDSGASHWSHGAYFGHSQHGEPGNTNPNRNSNSPSVDLSYGVPDLLLAYCLTGERRFRDVAIECLSAMKNMSEFSNFKDPVFQRERANLIFGYMEAYRQTADAKLLKELRMIVGHTADLSNKQWVTDPAAYGKKHPEAYVRMFQFNQVVWTLGRYLDFCGEYGIKDDLGVAGAVEAYANFVIKFAMTEYKPGRAAVPYDYVFDRSNKSYLDQNNWALVTADLLAYAYKYTGKKPYLATAAKFYATGTIDPVWKDDPPVYMGTKDLVNACNWGLVYMNQSLRAAGK